MPQFYPRPRRPKQSYLESLIERRLQREKHRLTQIAEKKNAPPLIHIVPRENTSPKWGRAFACGCSGFIYTDATFRNQSIALFGSPVNWSLLTTIQNSNLDWYYGDHAYFRRFVFYRCTKNAYQHTGLGNATPERFERLGIEIQSWQKDGRHVLVCPPDRKIGRLLAFDADAWLEKTLAKLQRATDRPIIVRQRHEGRPLYVDLRDCWAMVTHISNAAVEALIAGVPVFCTGHCAARWMGHTDLSLIEQPLYPDRYQWACNLADNQWTLDEMRQGLLWRSIGHGNV